MCYALLSRCRACSWIMHVSYPLCFHAETHAFSPATCPYRMKRRYIKEEICGWCLEGKRFSTEGTGSEGDDEDDEEEEQTGTCEAEMENIGADDDDYRKGCLKERRGRRMSRCVVRDAFAGMGAVRKEGRSVAGMEDAWDSGYGGDMKVRKFSCFDNDADDEGTAGGKEKKRKRVS
ncbi:hypothetical protein P154DRAFT_518172 [Amniculicola lignicola CBS 123094]|uniref:Uncharacterized protein n=1 Tax=Amniculicola lignicola CBS 123094 TaxID=1392246 RepID=A0A6A5WWE5_9PLEO|nr:hypothetical protein P154DRAFT_518172 [Amniculicola lignicola CBS 123094]